MLNISKLSSIVCFGMLTATIVTACSDNDDSLTELGQLVPDEQSFGKATGNFTAEEWYPGGQLGTTEKASYSAITPAAQAAGMEDDLHPDMVGCTSDGEYAIMIGILKKKKKNEEDA